MTRPKFRPMLRPATAIAAASLVLTATPSMAQDDDPYGCNRYARISCQVDGDDSYECFIARYEACIAFYQGGGFAPVRMIRQDYL